MPGTISYREPALIFRQTDETAPCESDETTVTPLGSVVTCAADGACGAPRLTSSFLTRGEGGGGRGGKWAP